jgi:hypothetical protein
MLLIHYSHIIIFICDYEFAHFHSIVLFRSEEIQSFSKAPYDWSQKARKARTHQSSRNPLQTKAIVTKSTNTITQSKKGGDWKKIREIERQSLTPYGRFAKHGTIYKMKDSSSKEIDCLSMISLILKDSSWALMLSIWRPRWRWSCWGIRRRLMRIKYWRWSSLRLGRGEQSRIVHLHLNDSTHFYCQSYRMLNLHSSSNLLSIVILSNLSKL